MRTLLLALLALVVSSTVHARVEITDCAMWPNDWPKSLHDIRAKAKTFDVAHGANETVIELKFETREAFLEAWPELVQIVSPHAPVSVHAIQREQPAEAYWRMDEPIVRVHAPPRYLAVTQVGGVRGHLEVAPPWPQELVRSDGSLPGWLKGEAVDGELQLVPSDPPEGMRYRCRVEIEVVADERIIHKSDIRRMPANGTYIDADAPAPPAEADQLQLHWQLPGTSDSDTPQD